MTLICFYLHVDINCSYAYLGEYNFDSVRASFLPVRTFVLEFMKKLSLSSLQPLHTVTIVANTSRTNYCQLMNKKTTKREQSESADLRRGEYGPDQQSGSGLLTKFNETFSQIK